MQRLAIYLGSTQPKAKRAELRRHFKDARTHGMRVVTVGHEHADAAATRPVLACLVERMEAGEFDAIMGVVDDHFTPSTLPRPAAGKNWVPHRSGAR